MHQVFYYKHSTITKGRLGELYKKYLALDSSEALEVRQSRLFSTIKNLIGQLERRWANELFDLLSKANSDELTDDALNLIKPYKDVVYNVIKLNKKIPLLDYLKDIFEGDNNNKFRKIFWQGHTELHRGRLAEIHKDYQALITNALLNMRNKELQPDNIKFIREFINGHGLFVLDDAIVSDVICKWVNNVAEKDVSATGIAYLKQYKPQLSQYAQSVSKDARSNLLSSLIDSANQATLSENLASFGSSFASLFSFSSSKKDTSNPTSAADFHKGL